MIEAGTVLQNRYLVQKRIGQGGMGAVYLATDERFGSLVAIKETFFTDENYRKAFEREARLLNNLRHPALPRVSDHFTEENGQFLVMEYITGDDLSEKLEVGTTPFPAKDVLNWADQLLDALDFLHTQEMPVIHRDIKPQNLKLTPRGQIILLDFGLAKGNPTSSSHQTAAQSVFGFSRNYASLEQIQGTGTDPRSDLYSLGATLYHLLTGIPPVDALTRAMTVLNGDEDPLPSADSIHKQVTSGVAEVLSRAMALNANYRPTSAVAMQTILAEAEKIVSKDLNTAAVKPPITDLLIQNTEVFENSPLSRQTEPGAIETEILPAAVSGDVFPINKPQTAPPGLHLFADNKNNSVETQLNTVNPNIQIPVRQNSETETQLPAEVTETKPGKRGMALGAAALGGLLLIGSAAGALYVFKPEVFHSNKLVDSAVIEKQEIPVNKPTETNSSEVTTANSTNINSTTNSVKKDTAVKKDNSPKAIEKAAVTDSSGASKNNSGDIPPTAIPPGKRTTAAEESDAAKADEDNVKIQGGKVETKNVIVDNGRVTFKNANRPPHKIPMPEGLNDLPPDQRRKIVRAMRRRNQQMQTDDPPNQP